MNRQNRPPPVVKIEVVQVEEKDLGSAIAAAAARGAEKTASAAAAAATDHEC